MDNPSDFDVIYGTNPYATTPPAAISNRATNDFKSAANAFNNVAVSENKANQSLESVPSNFNTIYGNGNNIMPAQTAPMQAAPIAASPGVVPVNIGAVNGSIQSPSGSTAEGVSTGHGAAPVGNEAGMGSLIGGIAGGIIGTVIEPGAGTAGGAALGSAAGGGIGSQVTSDIRAKTNIRPVKREINKFLIAFNKGK